EFFPTILQALLESAQPAAPSTSPTSSPTPSTDSILTLTASASPLADRRFTLTLHLTIAPGYHVDPAQLTAKIRSNLPPFSDTWILPPSSPYFGTIQLRADCSLPDEKIPPGRYMLRAIVEAQPCTESFCLAPRTLTAELPLDIK